jgi:hypothetical protein
MKLATCCGLSGQVLIFKYTAGAVASGVIGPLGATIPHRFKFARRLRVIGPLGPLVTVTAARPGADSLAGSASGDGVTRTAGVLRPAPGPPGPG